jgi:hypothetical protein
MKNGVYKVVSVAIPRYNNGKYGMLKRLVAETRNGVVIDFDKDPKAKGFVLEGNYWEIDGIHVRNTPDKVKGMTISGHNNHITWVSTYSNGDTGMQISGSASEPKTFWPSNNLIDYCESFNNRDGAEIDADGFASKLTVGEGNRFEWCVSHNNCDDGWDLFTKKETGSIGVVKFYACVSYDNGTMLDGQITRSKGWNGFKLGGEGISVRHEIRHSLSFRNGGKSYDSNANPAIYVENCTAVGSSGTNGGTIDIRAGDSTTPAAKPVNCLDQVSDLESTDFASILHPSPNFIVSGNNYVTWDTGKGQFLERDEAGKFILNVVYKPVGGKNGKGAWDLY